MSSIWDDAPGHRAAKGLDPVVPQQTPTAMDDLRQYQSAKIAQPVQPSGGSIWDDAPGHRASKGLDPVALPTAQPVQPVQPVQPAAVPSNIEKAQALDGLSEIQSGEPFDFRDEPGMYQQQNNHVKLAGKHFQDLVTEAQEAGKPVDVQAFKKQAMALASQEMHNARAQGREMVGYRLGSTGIEQGKESWMTEIEGGKGTLNPLSPTAIENSLRAWWNPMTIETLEPVQDEETGEWKVEYGSSSHRTGAMGFLNWLGQASPTTYLATGIKAGGFGSEEQLRLIREGEDMFTLYQDTAGEYNPLTKPIVWAMTPLYGEETATSVAGMMTLMPLAAVEPDLFMLGGGAVGKGLKVASKGAKAYKVNRMVKLADEVDEVLVQSVDNVKATTAVDLAEGDELIRQIDHAKDVRETMDAVKAVDKHVARTVEAKYKMKVGSALSVEPSARRSIVAAEDAFDTMVDITAKYIDDEAALKLKADEAVRRTDPRPSKRKVQDYQFQKVTAGKNPEAKHALAAAEGAALRARHISEEKVLANWTAQREIVARMAGGRAGRKVTPDVMKRAEDGVMEAGKKLQKAAAAVEDYIGDAVGLSKALDELDKARAAYQMANLQAADILGKAGVKALDDAIIDLTNRLADTRDEVERFHKVARKEKVLDLDLATHQREVSRIQKAAYKRAAGWHAKSMLSKVLKEVSDGYRAAADHVRAGTEMLDPKPLTDIVEKAVRGEGANSKDVLMKFEEVLGTDTLTALSRSEMGEPLRDLIQHNAAGLELGADAMQRLHAVVDIAPKFAYNKKLADTGAGLALATEESRRAYENLAPNFVMKAWGQLLRAWDNMKLGRKKLGPGNDEVLQIGKGVMDRAEKGRAELMAIIENVPWEERADILARYIGSNEVLDVKWSKGTPLMNQGPVSLWEDTIQFLTWLGKGDPDALKSSKSLKAIAMAWTKGGQDINPKLMGALENKVINALKAGKLSSDPRVASEELRSITQQVMGEAATKGGEMVTETHRVMGMMAQAAVLSSAMNRGVKALRRVTAGLSDDAIEAAVNLQARTEDGIPVGVSFAEAATVFEALGMPMKQVRALAEDGRKIDRDLIKFGDTTGERAILPRQWMDSAESVFQNIIKSGEAFSAPNMHPDDALYKAIMHRYGQWFSTSLTTGILFPQPAYFANIMAGNFAQVWAEVGFMAAVKSTSAMAVYPMDMTRQLPGIGKYIDQGRKAMADRLGVSIDKTLPSAIGSFFDPYTAGFFDPKLIPDAKKIQGRYRTFTMGELREWASMQGVLETFTGSTQLMQRLGRVDDSWVQKFGVRLSEHSDNWKSIASNFEQRMRVGLFMDLVANKGYSPQQAGKMVRDALYDWSHAGAAHEVSLMSSLIMFRRFWGLSLRQGGRILLDPVRKGMVDDLTDMRGMVASNNAWGRTMLMQKGVKATAWASQAEQRQLGPDHDWNQDGQLTEEDKYMWMMSQVLPWWAGKTARPWLNNQPMDPEDVSWYEEHTGKKVTHSAISMPSLTPLDTTSLITMFVADLLGYAAGVQSGEQVLRTNIEGLADMGGPVGSEALSGLADTIIADRMRFPTKGKGRTLRASEVGALQLVDQIGPAATGAEGPFTDYLYNKGWIWSNDDDPEGTVRTSTTALTLYRMTPILGTEIPRWLGPGAETIAADMGLTEGAIYLMGQWSGVGRRYYHDPGKTLDNVAKYDVADDIRGAINELDQMRPGSQAGSVEADKKELEAEIERMKSMRWTTKD